MPPSNSTNSLRAAQVLLSEADRDLQRALQKRLNGLGFKTIGPTALFRVGLNALDGLEDAQLSKLMDAVESRPTFETISSDFVAWCSEIAVEVGKSSPGLSEIYSSTQIGMFSNQGRFVAISLAEDGRCLVMGMQANPDPLVSGIKVSTIQQLFPSSLAVQISMSQEGARLAVLAIVAWLTFDDASIPGVRATFQSHKAIPRR